MYATALVLAQSRIFASIFSFCLVFTVFGLRFLKHLVFGWLGFSRFCCRELSFSPRVQHALDAPHKEVNGIKRCHLWRTPLDVDSGVEVAGPNPDSGVIYLKEPLLAAAESTFSKSPRRVISYYTPCFPFLQIFP